MLGLILFLGLWLGVKDVILRLVMYFPIVVIIELGVVISIMVSFVREVVMKIGLVLIQQIFTIP